MPKRLISIRIESKDFEKLQKEAEKKEITFSKFIRKKLNKNSHIELKGDQEKHANNRKIIAK